MSFKLNALFVFALISSLTLCSVPPIGVYTPWDDPDDRDLPNNERKVNNNSLTQYYTHPSNIDLKDFKKKYLRKGEKNEVKKLNKKEASKGSRESKK